MLGFFIAVLLTTQLTLLPFNHKSSDYLHNMTKVLGSNFYVITHIKKIQTASKYNI